jgi:hypothetical protein
LFYFLCPLFVFALGATYCGGRAVSWTSKRVRGLL